MVLPFTDLTKSWSRCSSGRLACDNLVVVVVVALMVAVEVVAIVVVVVVLLAVSPLDLVMPLARAFTNRLFTVVSGARPF